MKPDDQREVTRAILEVLVRVLRGLEEDASVNPGEALKSSDLIRARCELLAELERT